MGSGSEGDQRRREGDRKKVRTDPDTQLLFAVASEIGKTVGELRESITFEELLGWAAFFKFRSEKEAEAMKKAKGGTGKAGAKRGRR